MSKYFADLRAADRELCCCHSRRGCNHSRRSAKMHLPTDSYTGGSKGGGAMAPLAAWASTQNALKVAIFRLKIEKIVWVGGNAPSPEPS